MSILKFAALAATLLVATASGAAAHDVSGINRTQSEQVHRIDQLRKSGQLTRREYNALMAEQAHIAALEQGAQSDGYVSRREHRQIREAQRAAADHIYAESHDAEVNHWRVWKWNKGVRY